MGDHLDIVRFKKDQKIVSVDVEIWISGESHFQLLVFFALSDEPAVMDEFSSVFEIWVHDYGHEIVHLDHLNEKVIKRIIEVLLAPYLLGWVLAVWCFFLYILSGVGFLKDIVVLSHSLIQSVISVGYSEVSNCCSVLNELEQILMILDSLLGQSLVHGCQREIVDLLHDGIGLLFVFLESIANLSVSCVGLVVALTRKKLRVAFTRHFQNTWKIII